MIWLAPAASIAIVLALAPVLLHLLVHTRAERFPFPTLRFIRPTRLAAIRRHVLEDIALLAVRVAIIAAAVAAFAGPLLVTAGRRAAWNARLVRAVAVTSTPSSGQTSAPPDSQAFRTQRFDAAALPDAIHRAVSWLEAAPPARRELVIAGPLTVGSPVGADIAAVPADIGIRFERLGEPPAERTVPAASLIATAGVVRRTVTFSGAHTTVRDDQAGAPSVFPVEVIAAPDARPFVDAAIAAVVSQHVLAPAADRRARLFVVDRPASGPAPQDAGPILVPWMADAVARIARDRDLRAEIARQPSGLVDAPFSSAPWQPLLAAGDGRPVLAAAASAQRLVVASAVDVASAALPLLLRTIANSLAPLEDPARAEILPIADGQLRAWTRPPPAVTAPRVDTIDRDDRRWLWGAVLILLAVETWIRRARRAATDAIEPEAARVA